MDDNELGFIKIPSNKFRQLYDNLDETSINENMLKKMNELYSNYTCFSSNYDAKSLWEKKKIIAQKKHHKHGTAVHQVRNKPRVILIDVSDDMKCKKEFISYLNKLTDLNKDIIYEKIRCLIRIIDKAIINSLFDVLINFIKNSSNLIYIDVLYLFDNEFIDTNINNYINTFILMREWIPTDIIIENKILYSNDNYDKYCQYVKLKKQTLSLLKALIIICKRNNDMQQINKILIEIMKDMRTYIDKLDYKHIIELLLDDIIIITELYDQWKSDNIYMYEEYINYLKLVDLNKYEYSTKFKLARILNIF